MQDAEAEMASRAAAEDDADSDTRCVQVNRTAIENAAAMLGFDPDELEGHHMLPWPLQKSGCMTPRLIEINDM